MTPADPPLPDETRAALDVELHELQQGKQRWAQLALGERLGILDELNRDLQAVAERWVHASLEAKGLRPGEYGEGEEWIYLAVVFRLLRLLRGALAGIQRQGRPRLPGGLRTRDDGQIVAQVFPQALWERVFFAGVEGEVWIEPGVTEDALAEIQAAAYRRGRAAGQVTLVLGAGNVSALVPADFLHKLFVEQSVVLLKLNPVNSYLGPLIAQGFRALIAGGYLRVVQGGAAEGAYLCQHAMVDALHMTGSDRTFEAIVFGPGAQGARRKAERAPRNDKPFSAELGNISPVIVVPGRWSTADLDAVAGRLAAWLVNNAGFNCLTPRVVIQHRGWEQRGAFVRAVAAALGRVPPRRAYYPGAVERHATFLAAHPQALQLGASPPSAGQLPWTLVPDVDPEHKDDICFRTEAFCALMAETSIPAGDVPDYLERAVDLANDTLWGTLTATLLVHPASLRERAVARAVERAVARLRYGTVVINNSGGLAYYLALAPWGAYPGHDRYDIQSGVGVVQNPLMLARTQKSVVRTALRQVPDPSALSSRRFHLFGRSLALYEAGPSPLKAPGVLAHVLRS